MLSLVQILSNDRIWIQTQFCLIPNLTVFSFPEPENSNQQNKYVIIYLHWLNIYLNLCVFSLQRLCDAKIDNAINRNPAWIGFHFEYCTLTLSFIYNNDTCIQGQPESDGSTSLDSKPTQPWFLTRFYDPWIQGLIKLKELLKSHVADIVLPYRV